jgi:hypothetical protein
MAKCRKLVGHFENSQLRVQDTKAESSSNFLNHSQDVATRWWTTLSIVERLLK